MSVDDIVASLHRQLMVTGFENAYVAVNNLVSGGNGGKQVIHVPHEIPSR